MKPQNRINQRPEMSKKLKTFSVFLVIAVIFWFLNALDKEYITEISLPITFHNLPENTSISAIEMQKVSVKVKGYGFDIVGRLPKEFNELSIDVAKSSVKISEKSEKYYIKSAQLKDAISSALPDIFSVVSVTPDTLYFELLTQRTHKVPVRLRSKVQYAPSYMRSAPELFIPDSVSVYENEIGLNTISEIYIEKLPVEIKENGIFEVKIIPIKNVKIRQKTVKVKISAEQYSEKKVEIPVSIINLPDDVQMLVFPKKVSLKLKIPISLYPHINESNFKATINFDSINAESQKFLIPKINYFPISDFYFLPDELRPFPERLDYIIEHK